MTSSDAGTLTTDIRLANPGTESLEVIALEAETPGLATAGPEVPFEVPPGESLSVPLTWTVTNCRLALQWLEPQLLYAYAGESSARGHHPLDSAAQAELVLLVDRVCGGSP
ncbi:hypothetical protein E1262_26900 [Jiangella aurantiaca]|uniref:DUF4232 domain-containing protein n=1 Tax=Jiangella aurantiaca TaxID=2530373 RepID=A0A4R4ZZQ2_9ACTN|nr:hypothetical protein E1262_26900 [Jiangella aurantiaca]